MSNLAKIRRINVWGAPCSGKSTVASWIFAELKMRDIEVEYSPEYIKWWTFTNQSPRGLDQIYVSATMLHQEDLILKKDRAGILVTDCPILLGCYYGVRNEVPGIESFIEIATVFENVYPSLNIMLDPDGIDFTDTSRFHTKDESKNIQDQLIVFLQQMGMEKRINNFRFLKTLKRDEILDYVLMVLGE